MNIWTRATCCTSDLEDSAGHRHMAAMCVETSSEHLSRLRRIATAQANRLHAALHCCCVLSDWNPSQVNRDEKRVEKLRSRSQWQCCRRPCAHAQSYARLVVFLLHHLSTALNNLQIISRCIACCKSKHQDSQEFAAEDLHKVQNS